MSAPITVATPGFWETVGKLLGFTQRVISIGDKVLTSAEDITDIMNGYTGSMKELSAIDLASRKTLAEREAEAALAK